MREFPFRRLFVSIMFVLMLGAVLHPVICNGEERCCSEDAIEAVDAHVAVVHSSHPHFPCAECDGHGVSVSAVSLQVKQSGSNQLSSSFSVTCASDLRVNPLLLPNYGEFIKPSVEEAVLLSPPYGGFVRPLLN